MALCGISLLPKSSRSTLLEFFLCEARRGVFPTSDKIKQLFFPRISSNCSYYFLRLFYLVFLCVLSWKDLHKYKSIARVSIPLWLSFVNCIGFGDRCSFIADKHLHEHHHQSWSRQPWWLCRSSCWSKKGFLVATVWFSYSSERPLNVENERSPNKLSHSWLKAWTGKRLMI